MSDSNNLADVLKAASGREPISDPPPDDGPPDDEDDDVTAEGAASDYDTDILLWSERQAELLRSRAVNALDWDNLAEEIVDVGRSELRAVASHLVQALLHDLKAEAWPLSREVPHWRAEARGHRDDARAAFTQSMAQREELEIAELYGRALHRMPETIDGVPPLPVPQAGPVTLDELLAPEAA